MNILWLSWKDINHPEAGGAEKVSDKLRQQLVTTGHTVHLVTASYSGVSNTTSDNNGVAVTYVGNRYTTYWRTFRYCKTQLKDWPDLVIDEMNTLPFWASLYYHKKPTYLLAYQLAREVWFYQMLFPLSLIGYLLEPIMLYLLSKTGYAGVITESISSRDDIRKYGFKKINIFNIWLDLKPVDRLATKQHSKTVLSLGAVRPMKRTLSAVKAFEVAHTINPSINMVIAGDISSSYAKKVVSYIDKSKSKESIRILGRVTNEDRLILMRDAFVILVTSIKEGWGLIVTEANSQGTPAIVFDTDGLRDSVQHNKTGLVVPAGDNKSMGNTIIQLLNDKKLYERLQENAWSHSKDFTEERTFNEFSDIIKVNTNKVHTRKIS